MASFPIACFTCRKRIAHLYERYTKMVADGKGERQVLDELNLGRPCCRRMFLTHADTDKYMLLFPTFPDRIQRLTTTKIKDEASSSESDSDLDEEEVEESFEEDGSEEDESGSDGSGSDSSVDAD